MDDIRQEAKVGEVIVCVNATWNTSLHSKYRVVEKNDEYYAIIDDSGNLNRFLYRKRNFLPESVFNNIMDV